VGKGEWVFLIKRKKKKERKGTINQNQYDADAFVFPKSRE